jgi:signal peptidase II
LREPVKNNEKRFRGFDSVRNLPFPNGSLHAPDEISSATRRQPQGTAMRAVPLNRYCVFFLIAGTGLALDLATKRWMFDWLGMPSGREPYWIWPQVQVFGFQTSLNEGALFGMGQGMVWFFALLSIAAAMAICWWLFVAGAARQWVLTVALSGIMAGILGNLYDRVGLPGLKWNFPNHLHDIGDRVFAVRDWILVMFRTWHWPNFNIADSLLVCGALVLAWHAFFQKDPKDSSTAA